MTPTKQKLYAYVDESGQDTQGALFVVGVVVLDSEREPVLHDLERVEKNSGKNNIKWHKSRPQKRRAYIEGLLQLSSLKRKIFFETFTNTDQYLEMTSYATAKAILEKAQENYIVSIFVDGLKKREVELFEQEIKKLRIKKRKVRGVRKEENDAFIRLADAVCGLVRDAKDTDEWAKDALRKLRQKEIITAL